MEGPLQMVSLFHQIHKLTDQKMSCRYLKFCIFETNEEIAIKSQLCLLRFLCSTIKQTLNIKFCSPESASAKQALDAGSQLNSWQTDSKQLLNQVMW